ncbi:probable phosphomevalonate kinase [Scaptodrosophila lebanonensis]|uniref:Phosphomevalonate kinase n=1 Tax=Drosophila lebanonensis TaxID=7225 RepID=A0A6J2TJL1_DROLE|nr:probable phosphomevalonate kinase [Scaptodrosophila lebanonensis]XP_030376851.1 probable phosphomevalonate kinase [Scaptodrosophila lebanonensis]
MRKILLISGKRKCGKDFLSERLQKRLGDRALIVRISEPIKTEWARKLELNLNSLLSDGPYKEQYRRDMIVWSDEVRARDYGYFCRMAMTQAPLDLVDVVIVSDIRRTNDVRWFRETYGDDVVQTLRLTSLPETRKARGWNFTAGVDDVASECDLDDYQFDCVLPNDAEMSSEQLIEKVLKVFKLS